MKKTLNSEKGKFAYEGLDRIIHEKARLGILTSLLTNNEGLLFNELKELCDLSDGNLSRHIKALNEAELVDVWKGFNKNKPQTLCKLSKYGKTKFISYLAELEKVINNAAAEIKTSKTEVSEKAFFLK